MQVIEIPDAAPRGQQVASQIPALDPVVLEYTEHGALASDAQVLAVSSPLESGSGGGVGSLPFSTRTVTVDTAAHPGELLEVDASAGEIAITPPPHPLPGSYVTVIKTDAGPNLVHWQAQVNGDPQGAALQGAMAGATFIYDGAQWFIESVNTSYSAMSSGGITAEDAQDIVATMFASGTQNNISFAYNDAVGSLSASVPTPSWSTTTGKPTFAAVATSGAYGDLSGRPAPVAYVQPSAPVGASAPYLWVQTGLPGGGITIWVEDGS